MLLSMKKAFLLAGWLVAPALAMARPSPPPAKIPEPPAEPRPLVRTDLDAYNNGGPREAPPPKIWLESRVYEIAPANGDHATHLLMLDQSANNPGQVLGIWLEKDKIEDGESTPGYIYQGRVIENGRRMMLSPVYIDGRGNIGPLSETDPKAPVFLVTREEDKLNYPYRLIPRNGAQHNQLFVMRAAQNDAPRLRDRPVGSRFQACGQGPTVIVEGDSISVSHYGSSDSTYKLVAQNGGRGQFAALVESDFNTMAETESPKDQVRKLAFFLQYKKNQMLLVANPDHFDRGRYDFEVFEKRRRDFKDVFFPGGL